MNKVYAKLAALIIASSVGNCFTTTMAQTCPAYFTSDDQLGPFFIDGAPETTTLAPESQLISPSDVLVVNGTIYGDDCERMSNVWVDVWYAGKGDGGEGVYSLPGSDLKYRAHILTNEFGQYEYTATFPESYPERPIRHIHYRISKDDEELLVTQLYFEGYILDGYNPDASQIGMLSTDEDGTRHTNFDIHINLPHN